jgi:hypothetical protein
MHVEDRNFLLWLQAQWSLTFLNANYNPLARPRDPATTPLDTDQISLGISRACPLTLTPHNPIKPTFAVKPQRHYVSAAVRLDLPDPTMPIMNLKKLITRTII